MTRKEQAQLTKQRISSAALNLAATKSFSDIKISDICAASGVSVGSFYHYFSSKEAVFLQIDEAFEQWMESRISKRSSASNLEKLNLLIHDFLINSVISTWQGLSTTYALNLMRSELPAETPYFVSEIKNYLREGCESGEFTLEMSVDLTANLILILLRGLNFDWAYTHAKFDILESGNRLIQETLNLVIKPVTDSKQQ